MNVGEQLLRFSGKATLLGRTKGEKLMKKSAYDAENLTYKAQFFISYELFESWIWLWPNRGHEKLPHGESPAFG